MSTQQELLERHGWWSSLNHGGLLIAPSKLVESFPEELPPLPRFLAERLRRDVVRAQEDEKHLGSLLDTVLEGVLGLSRERWVKGSDVGQEWTRRAVTREAIRPSRLWRGPNGVVLPVFVADRLLTGTREEGVVRLGVGRGRRVLSRVLEWLRSAEQPVALVATSRQLRLVYAALEADAFCEWDTALWFQEGAPGPQVTALRALLSADVLTPPAEHEPSRLLQAIQASRRGQSELSTALGERVRQAVERLIQESSGVLEALEAREKESVPGGGAPVSRRDIYLAATRLVMRCVVILFAEARGLLPRHNAVYDASYGLQGLREHLDRLAGGRAGERLRQGFSAWPRLMSLFSLVFHGSAHESLPIPRYGGGLFTPGDATSEDPVLRALAAFESAANAPSDAHVHWMLERLCRSRVKVRQGRASRWVEAPVDFSALSSEYIGILYEGLLDYELRRAPERDAMVFLAVGDQPALPLSRLDGMSDADLAKLLEKLSKAEKEDTGEEEEEAEAAEEGEETGAEAEAGGEGEAPPAESTEPALAEEGDYARVLAENLRDWGRRAVKAAKLVKYPRDDSDAQVRAQYERDLDKAASALVAKVVSPGRWFLVRWGGTRKGSGTFYTRPQLAAPIVRRALQPLIDRPVAEGEDSPGVKTPEEILALKVCDPAMGSGSFLVSALRFLAEALRVSLYAHGRLGAKGQDTVIRLADGKPAGHPSEDILQVPQEHPEFEERLLARLKRHVVERCLYGVDLDPLAVELGRTALWVETMDYQLPFGFLDHKLKCGNALVGCWFDRFRDYPVMAWEREGGDKGHDRFVHHFREVPAKKSGAPAKRSGDKWTAAIKQRYAEVIKPELKSWLSDLDTAQGRMELLPGGKTADALHDDALQIFEELHALPVHEAEQREEVYRQKILRSEPLKKLRAAFDTWCALWFWPGDALDVAPTPRTLLEPGDAARVVVERLTRKHHFFHWELEFPDVFTGPEAGFHAIVGNPPWETLQPNSLEFFSNSDPLYRTYVNQEAGRRQQELFRETNGEVEQEWLTYTARFKALANWMQHAAYPFGDDSNGTNSLNFGRDQETPRLIERWRSHRVGRKSYADSEHPFRYQGTGKSYTYRMFLESAYALLMKQGSLGFLVPSGIYSDKGSAELRTLLLERCDWTHLYAFQNERFVFEHIHHSFKMAVVHVRKGDRTTATLTRFRLGPGDSPEAHEAESDLLDTSSYLELTAERLRRFSPNNGALLEICSAQDLSVLGQIYNAGTPLGDSGNSRLKVGFQQGDFNMTSDSALFPRRTAWEAEGYIADEHGYWLKGNWKECAGSSFMERGRDLVCSWDGRKIIAASEIEDAALPFYQGIMVKAFDPSAMGWISGTGLRAIWSEIGTVDKRLLPQYLMSRKDFLRSGKSVHGWKVAYRRIARTTDARTWIGCVLSGVPAGDSLFFLIPQSGKADDALALSAVLNSYVYDWGLRNRLAGTNLSWFVIEETVRVSDLGQQELLAILVARLSAVMVQQAPLWCELVDGHVLLRRSAWRRSWAITPHERLRLRCILDAVVAKLYGLDVDDFAWILRDCDHPVEKVCNKPFSRTLDPKGFWRVDKEKEPELRHTVLSLVAFHELKRMGLESFLALNDGDGWMIPDTLRLADYGLGHDERAKQHQPVASRLGDRFLPWQLEQGVEESWEECRRHAELISRIVPPPASPSAPAPELAKVPMQPQAGETDLLGNPLEKDLFGNVIEPQRKRKRRG